MTGFEYLPHTADVGIAAYGKDLPELFANAAAGMFSVITDLSQVGDGETREVTAAAEDIESLLIAWLNELLFVFDVEHLLLKRFEVSFPGENHLRAIVRGEKYDPSRHRFVKGVKAATYHRVQVSENDGYRAQFYLDV